MPGKACVIRIQPDGIIRLSLLGYPVWEDVQLGEKLKAVTYDQLKALDGKTVNIDFDTGEITLYKWPSGKEG